MCLAACVYCIRCKAAAAARKRLRACTMRSGSRRCLKKRNAPNAWSLHANEISSLSLVCVCSNPLPSLLSVGCNHIRVLRANIGYEITENKKNYSPNRRIPWPSSRLGHLTRMSVSRNLKSSPNSNKLTLNLLWLCRRLPYAMAIKLINWKPSVYQRPTTECHSIPPIAPCTTTEKPLLTGINDRTKWYLSVARW